MRGEKAILKERNHKLEIRCLDFKYDANAYEKLLEACRCNLNLERRKERRHRNDVIRKQENNFKSAASILQTFGVTVKPEPLEKVRFV